jgi:hypothetical protein
MIEDKIGHAHGKGDVGSERGERGTLVLKTT